MSPKAKAVAKRNSKHEVPAEMRAKKAELVAARDQAKRTLRAVKARDNKEARQRKNLHHEAKAMPLPLLRQVIQAKTDLPDLICPHCNVSMDCRAEMTAAFVAVDNGRAVQPAGPPKPLAAPAGPVSATGAGADMAAAA